MANEREVDSQHAPKETSQPKINPLWMAGMIEIGAANIGLQVRGSECVPIIKFKGTKDKVDGLANFFLQTGQRTMQGLFTITGESAVQILQGIPPEFTPKASLIIQATLARDLSALTSAHLQQEASPDVNEENAYAKLVQRDEFLAGVLDAQSSFSPHGIVVSSQNISLLKAMAKEYIGDNSVYYRDKNRTSGVIHIMRIQEIKRLRAALEMLCIKQQEGQELLMRPREKTSQEIAWEKFANEHARYLAGLFTHRGRIGIGTKPNGEDVALVPLLRITGSEEDIHSIRDMLSVFSPSMWTFKNQPGKRYALAMSFRKALTIIKAIAPYFFRDTAVTLIAQGWDQLSVEERVTRWQELQQNPPSTRKPYKKLLQDPQWLAGFLDGPSTFFLGHRKRGGMRYPVASILSTNPELLELFHAIHGGSKPYKRREENSFVLDITGSDLRRLYNFVKDYLIVRREKARELLGWSEPEFIANVIVDFIMTSFTQPRSKEELIQHVEKILRELDNPRGIRHSIYAEEIDLRIQQLIQDGRIYYKDFQYLPTFHSSNIDAIEKSPIALQSLLQQGLTGRLIIAQTGKIIGVGGVNGEITWYVPDHEARSIREAIHNRNYYLRRQNRSDANFLQFTVNGTVVDYINIKKISDISPQELGATKEALTSALTESLFMYAQTHEGLPQGMEDVEAVVQKMLDALNYAN